MMNRVAKSLLASCCIALLALCCVPHAHADSPGPTVASPDSANGSEEAGTRFKRGLELFGENEFALALIEFTRAYELAPNFRALYNIGLVNIQLGRYTNATSAFEQFLADGGDLVPAARRDEVQTYLNALKLRTATVMLLSRTPGVDVVLDGQPVGKTPFAEPLKVDAGEHTLRASAIGFQPKTFALKLAGQDEKTLTLELDRIPTTRQAEGPSRKIFWPGFAAAGAVGAGALASGILMFQARNDLADLKDEPNSSSRARADAADRANVTALTADILGGVAIATAGVSLYLSLRKERPKDTLRVSVSPRSVHATFRF